MMTTQQRRTSDVGTRPSGLALAMQQQQSVVGIDYELSVMEHTDRPKSDDDTLILINNNNTTTTIINDTANDALNGAASQQNQQQQQQKQPQSQPQPQPQQQQPQPQQQQQYVPQHQHQRQRSGMDGPYSQAQNVAAVEDGGATAGLLPAANGEGNSSPSVNNGRATSGSIGATGTANQSGTHGALGATNNSIHSSFTVRTSTQSQNSSPNLTSSPQPSTPLPGTLALSTPLTYTTLSNSMSMTNLRDSPSLKRAESNLRSSLIIRSSSPSANTSSPMASQLLFVCQRCKQTLEIEESLGKIDVGLLKEGERNVQLLSSSQRPANVWIKSETTPRRRSSVLLLPGLSDSDLTNSFIAPSCHRRSVLMSGEELSQLSEAISKNSFIQQQTSIPPIPQPQQQASLSQSTNKLPELTEPPKALQPLPSQVPLMPQPPQSSVDTTPDQSGHGAAPHLVSNTKEDKLNDDQCEPANTAPNSTGTLNSTPSTYSPVVAAPSAPRSPSPGSPMQNTQSLRYYLALSELFTSSSEISWIDQPLCSNCAHILIAELEDLSAERETQKSVFCHYIQSLDDSGDVQLQLTDTIDKELARLEAEEMQLEQELCLLEQTSQSNITEMQYLSRQCRKLNYYERRYWELFDEHHRDSAQFTELWGDTRTALSTSKDKLAFLNSCNPLNEAFNIWFEGHFVTVNDFRLGRLPSQQLKVEWAENNAAWGYASLLIVNMARLLNYDFKGYRLTPLGCSSRVEKLDSHITYELFGDPNVSIGRLFWYRRFDNAVAGFVCCVKELADYMQAVDPGFVLPYPIKDDHVGELSVRIQFNNEDTWTKSLKNLMVNCKFMLQWCVCHNGHEKLNRV
ncbi:autophagy protein Apg6 family protein [Pelomyxa schiedti]|nr:autophagy protein Apg6 family protein [Pelomyxa schiedti]